MALEVGKLVARIDIEGNFDQKLAQMRSAFQQTARAAEDLDERVSRLGKTPKVDFPDAPKRKMDDAAASASKLDDSVKKASASGKNMRVSDQPKTQLKETASVADQVDSRFKGLGITMKGLAMTAGAAGMGAVVMKGWDRITAIDSAQAKLKGLGHEAGNVDAIMANALASVKGTSFGLGDAAGIAASAVAAGIQPGKELERTLKLTGDAATIAGTDIGAMGSIVNKVATSDMMQMDVANQMMDAGIPILQMVAAELGVTADEARKMASDGKVSFATFQNALETGLGGAALASGETLRGSLANVGAAIGRLGAAGIDPFKDQILEAAGGVTDFADSMSAILAPAASLVAGGLGEVASIVGKIPTPILGATAALVALQQTGLGPKMAGAASSAVGALKGVGDTIALQAMYAGDGVRTNGLLASSLHGMKGAGAAAAGGLKSVVSMLGGPWMIGMAAAGMLIADFISASRSAAEVQKKMEEASASSAAAQNDLADALMRSNGEMDDQAAAAAQKIIQAELAETTARAEENVNVVNDLDSAIKRNSYSYNDWVYRSENARTAMDRNAASHEMAKLEMEAMGNAAAAAGIEVDDFARIAAEGGPKWNALKAALADTGDAGVAMIGKLESGRATVDKIVDSATEAEIASTLLAEAFRLMADESSTAEDKANALKSALDALAGDTMTADEALGAYYETLDKLQDGTTKLAEGSGAFAREIEGQGLAFDMSSEKSRGLRDAILEMRDATADAASAGLDMGPIWEQNRAQMERMAAQTPYTAEQLWQLAEAVGFIPEKIEAVVAVHGAGAVAGELAVVAEALTGVEKGAVVEVKNVNDEALTYLQQVGWEVQRIPGTTDVRITAQTAEAQAQLQGTIQMAANLENADPNVSIETNADWVTAALGLTADTVNALPDGHVEITDTTDANIDRLRALGVEAARDKSGRVIINDADVDRARQRVTDLNNIRTESRHTVIIGTVNRGGNDVATDGITVGQHYADGGIRGSLPRNATIAAPQGNRGVVQWAEAETGGEAFIPLAPAKRPRSLAIWKETGRRLGVEGVDYAFADGGIMASGLIDLAKRVEGKPYVWGGVNFGDCSGAVSALANYVSGRSPFGSRFATGNQRQALRERGFVNGRGGAGDLRIGWYNGGPYGGHTSATLPNGVNFEMGGARGNGQYGGSAAGADSPAYTDHAYFPMSRFADIDAAVTGDAVSAIGTALGTGNPSMPNDPGSPSASGVDLTVSGGAPSGSGTPVFVTNWPGSGGGGGDTSVTAKITGETSGNGFIEGASPAGMIANALGRGDLIKPIEAFANGGFHGLENHSAHIAPQGSMRIFAEPETGGEAYIPLASHKRARSTAIWMETGRRLGYSIGAGVNLAGSVLTGNGLDTGWGGPGLADLGIDTNALKEAIGPGVQSEAARAGEQIAAILADLGQSIDQNVGDTLKQVNDGKAQLRQQYARAMI